MLHTRPNLRIAALDTHMMTFLREKGYTTLDNTPSNPNVYKQLEKIFIEEADKAGKTVADFDLAIWNKYSKYGNTHVKKTKVKKNLGT
jgi:thermostable 8-oxoguanine DNA glycosylase